jgi:hypothetical protein
VDDRARRLAQNEALFRDVNEHVSEVNAHWSASDGAPTFDVICECAHESCAETFAVTREAYEAVRAEPARFLVLPGHEITEVERVVGDHETYFVVEKTGESKRYVEGLDPRARR